MGEPCKQHVLQGIQLLLECGIDIWMAVSEEVHPPGTDGIEVTMAVEIFQPDPPALAYRYEWQPFVILHLCAGMPQNGKVTHDEVII
jgi:hypothetical protein